MEIILASALHVDAVWTLMQRCHDALLREGIAQWDSVYPTREVPEKDVSRGALYVLESVEGVAGCMTLDEVQAKEYAEVAWTGGEPALVVHRVCIDPAFQGHGLSHRLMDFVEAHAARRGYASIRLDAYSANARSVALYRRRGYREAGQIFFPRRPLPFHCFELLVRPG